MEKSSIRNDALRMSKSSGAVEGLNGINCTVFVVAGKKKTL